MPERVALPAAVLALHGQLPCVAFALAHLRPGTRAGFVQTPGGALPAALSDTVADLLHRGLLAGHVSAGPCHGAADEAITVEGALDAAMRRLGWDCAIVGPGPGILGLQLLARPRRARRAVELSRRAVARLPGRTCSAHVERRRARAPSRSQPPHRDGAHDAAASGARGRSGRSVAALRRRPRARDRARLRARGRTRRRVRARGALSFERAYRLARWAVRWTRTATSSSLRSRAGRCSPT